MQFHSKSSDLENQEISLQKMLSKIKITQIKRRCSLCSYAETPLFYTFKGTECLDSFSIASNNFLSFAQDENEETLIQPCFCNTFVHKKCLKHCIINQKSHQCQNCQGKYQARLTKKELAKYCQSKESAKVIWMGVLNLFMSIIIGLFLMRVNEQYQTINQIFFITLMYRTDTIVFQDLFLKVLVYSLSGLSFIITIFYMTLMVVNNIRRSVIYDIELYCYQANIEQHNPSATSIIQKFYQKVHTSGILNQFQQNYPLVQEAPILSKIFSRDFDNLKEN